MLTQLMRHDLSRLFSCEARNARDSGNRGEGLRLMALSAAIARGVDPQPPPPPAPPPPPPPPIPWPSDPCGPCR